MPTSGWGMLGEVLGGGIDREGAYNEGRLRTAQTERALSEARRSQLAAMGEEAENRAREQRKTVLVKTGKYTPEEVDLIDSLLTTRSGSDFSSTMTGLGTQQEIGLRDILSSETATPEAQFRAGQGVQGKVLPRLEALGPGGYYDISTGPKPELLTTPLGESRIEANVASAAASRARAGDPDYATVSGTGGVNTVDPVFGKVPLHHMVNPAFDRTKPATTDNPPFVPVPGGPADPNAPTKQGSIEARFNERVFMSVAQTIPDVVNTMMLPSTATAGIFGRGAPPGQKLTQAGIDTLRNTFASDVTRAYVDQSAQLARGMAWIESNGAVPNETVLRSYDNLIIREGDTGFDVLRKMANIRQTIDQLALVKLSNPRVPEVMKQTLRDLQSQMATAIPFSVQDVMTLQFGGGKYHTITDLMNDKGLGSTPVAAPTANPAAPAAADTEGWQTVDVNGQQVRVRVKRGP